MEKIEKKYRFGLVGKNIAYSFSRGYFTKKFEQLDLELHTYENFDLSNIEEIENVLKHNNDIKGLNVTIPYKQDILNHLTSIDSDAEKIGAVNTIKISGEQRIGYNTDVYGFEKSIEPYLKLQHTKALILGTGGASKAVAFVFEKLNIDYKFVSRNPKKGQLNYKVLNKNLFDDYTILVNCTPLGTHPNIEQKPQLPYQYITTEHLLFDLIYNPEKTAFLKEGEKNGATITNGHLMLKLQAEKAWKIWNS